MWLWHEMWYAPVRMEGGTLQARMIRTTAAWAWEDFCKATRKTKAELIAEGYRVKRIQITEAFTVPYIKM